MHIVIDIPDTAYQGIINANNASGNWNNDLLGVLCRGVANGTQLPKGHGRLIDADQLKKIIKENDVLTMTGFSVKLCDINNTPTIIEADKEGSEKE